jgi:2-polyprenyl-6-methoxyphenol hydroxylase-like FAD-dependent oxidoreductase
VSARYDLVVGADGIRSRVRELAFDGDRAPDYTGVVVWRALLDRPAEAILVPPPWQRAGSC